MKFKDLSIKKGMTVHLGGRQFHKVEVALGVEFDETDDFEAGAEKVTAWVNSKLVAEIEQITSDAKPPKKQTLME